VTSAPHRSCTSTRTPGPGPSRTFIGKSKTDARRWAEGEGGHHPSPCGQRWMSPGTCQERFASLRDGLRPHLTEPVRRPPAPPELLMRLGLHTATRRGCRPVPRFYGLAGPCFSTTLRPARTRQDLPCTSAGEPRTPVDRRAISVQLAPATSGLSRSLADTPARRSGHVKGRSRTDSQADSTGLALP
jgi:hypothetical protein